eukprot:COSAG02_NODE_5643_length_4159_cov_7.496798_1_plen_529_part_00
METTANPLTSEAQTRAVGDEPQQPLLEVEFTPSQVEALRAAFGKDAVWHASTSKQQPDESTEDAIARLKETPCNWHQATVFACSTEDPLDKDLRKRAPTMLCFSAFFVLLQLLTVISVLVDTIWPPCDSNNDQCLYPGTFCEPRGLGYSRCAYCGNYSPIKYQYDSETDLIYNQMMIDGWVSEERFGGFNMTTVEATCRDPRLSASIFPWVHAATCYDDDDLPEFKQVVCPGASELGEPSPRYEEYVHAFCNGCVRPAVVGEPPRVQEYTGNVLAQSNIRRMSPADWAAYLFCSGLIALAVVEELKDINLCAFSISEAQEKISPVARAWLQGLNIVRRWSFLPSLSMVIVALVANQGGSALNICFNSVAMLFSCEIDNVAYRVGLPEAIRSRVEVAGRFKLTASHSAFLWRSKIVHLSLLPVVIIITTIAFLWSGMTALGYIYALFLVAGVIEELDYEWGSRLQFEREEQQNQQPKRTVATTVAQLGRVMLCFLLGLMAWCVRSNSTIPRDAPLLPSTNVARSRLQLI